MQACIANVSWTGETLAALLVGLMKTLENSNPAKRKKKKTETPQNISQTHSWQGQISLNPYFLNCSPIKEWVTQIKNIMWCKLWALSVGWREVDEGQTLLRTVRLLPVSDGLVVLQLWILPYERQPQLHVDLWEEDSVKGAFKSLQKLLCF